MKRHAEEEMVDVPECGICGSDNIEDTCKPVAASRYAPAEDGLLTCLDCGATTYYPFNPLNNTWVKND